MDLKQFIAKQTDFSLSIAKHVISAMGKDDRNIVFSPFSINVSLAMIDVVKSKSTESTDELWSGLMYDASPCSGVRLAFSNCVLVSESIRIDARTRDIINNNYRASFRHVDFTTEGHGKNRSIKMRQKFANLDPPNQGQPVRVPFMTSHNIQTISDFQKFQVLRLPYQRGRDSNRRFSMYIFLPTLRNGLPSLIERACSEPGFIERHLPCKLADVGEFYVPKFKIAFNFEATEILKKLGLVSDMSRILHKSFIEVNEDGVEAAAATIDWEGDCDCDFTTNFVADRPFLYVTREDTEGVLLFIGTVLDPATQ